MNTSAGLGGAEVKMAVTSLTLGGVHNHMAPSRMLSQLTLTFIMSQRALKIGK